MVTILNFIYVSSFLIEFRFRVNRVETLYILFFVLVEKNRILGVEDLLCAHIVSV